MEEEKVDIMVQPIKKIVVLDCTEFSIEDFFKRIDLIAMSGTPIALNWAEGIVFLYFPYQPDSDIIIEQALKGTVHWGAVLFARMPEYNPLKKVGAREIPIIDQTPVRYLRQAAKWLKKQQMQATG